MYNHFTRFGSRTVICMWMSHVTHKHTRTYESEYVQVCACVCVHICMYILSRLSICRYLALISLKFATLSICFAAHPSLPSTFFQRLCPADSHQYLSFLLSKVFPCCRFAVLSLTSLPSVWYKLRTPLCRCCWRWILYIATCSSSAGSRTDSGLCDNSVDCSAPTRMHKSYTDIEWYKSYVKTMRYHPIDSMNSISNKASAIICSRKTYIPWLDLILLIYYFLKCPPWPHPSLRKVGIQHAQTRKYTL